MQIDYEELDTTCGLVVRRGRDATGRPTLEVAAGSSWHRTTPRELALLVRRAGKTKRETAMKRAPRERGGWHGLTSLLRVLG